MFTNLIKRLKITSLKEIFRPKSTRYFYFESEDENYLVSTYIKGEKTLLALMAEFVDKYSYDIEFTIREVSKEEFEKAGCD
jgi:hypothetical protein